ncbi:hydroxyacid dehydrogenase [Mediterraneibacter sp. NSJ-55]|uniref:Hydroxyacid dehydrogenase n=1 Tax=Mediterraneibacter hominis TaxID=2763054 RepID=A0A923RR90_9FIRM|nr:hydroxyacid dehydrogenase [Mediterraneibacter hominis]MBC5689448.1 hydroxyacid dehydrogenase [Mediterraneibacter hominis]
MKLKKKVLITQFIHPDGMKILEDAIEHVVLAPDPKPETLLSMMDESIDGIIVRHNRLTSEMIQKCPNLQVIARHGIGTELIDLEAATKQGVIVTNTPHAATVSVAEHTMMYILMLGRKIMTADKEQKKGNFAIKVTYKPDDIEGKTVGIIGLGHIGSIVAKYCNIFDMNVIAYDPRLSPEDGAKYGAKMMPDMDSVLKKADFVTLHTPQTEETIHMMSTEQFEKMKPSAYFINCSRGPIVDEKALIEALENQTIAGAALDVFETEPTDKDGKLLDAYQKLFSMENLIISPHSSALTVSGSRKMAVQSAEQMVKVLKGEKADWIVNTAVLEKL